MNRRRSSAEKCVCGSHGARTHTRKTTVQITMPAPSVPHTLMPERRRSDLGRLHQKMHTQIWSSFLVLFPSFLLQYHQDSHGSLPAYLLQERLLCRCPINFSYERVNPSIIVPTTSRQQGSKLEGNFNFQDYLKYCNFSEILYS